MKIGVCKHAVSHENESNFKHEFNAFIKKIENVMRSFYFHKHATSYWKFKKGI